MPPSLRLTWDREDRSFEAVEPDAALVARFADRLRDWYNAHDNASMMDGSGVMTRDDVVEFWRDLRASGGRGFLGFVDGRLVGDADLRSIGDGAAEFALMIGPAAEKGRGIGRTLASMIHVFAFRELGLERVFVPPRRDNHRVHALNAFLGYERDESPRARAFADGPDAETFSLAAATFRDKHRAAWREVEVRA
ncbi:MAG: GNAT family N-acetyltransferase [Labilithrix sp.]|nr:GNAT family N-acetyltransferase [Labilithrix sp.]